MANFDVLRQFILSEMRMSQVYQPVMLIELLKSDGEAHEDYKETKMKGK